MMPILFIFCIIATAGFTGYNAVTAVEGFKKGDMSSAKVAGVACAINFFVTLWNIALFIVTEVM